MLDKHNKDKEVKKFVKNKMDRANWFINAINQREITCKKVMLSIIKHQKAYFDSDDKLLFAMEEVGNRKKELKMIYKE